MYESTSTSLLIRVQSPQDRAAWSRFVELYTPLIFFWARKQGVPSSDAADLVQDVMTILVRKLPDFRYDKKKSFRGWLRKVTLNQYRQRCRRQNVPIADTTDSHLLNIAEDRNGDDFWEREYSQRLVGRAIQLMQSSFEEPTWRACKAYLLDGRSAEDVAAEFGISVWTVYSAKSRLIKRLRDELQGLLD
ncbi:MAG: sigma-70 family RNA polymerase sigma factor [Pirellulaceae bacterium]|nr:sigma-70 family RNA polymerase sigma factor [Planctomycetales bacterium]